MSFRVRLSEEANIEEAESYSYYEAANWVRR